MGFGGASKSNSALLAFQLASNNMAGARQQQAFNAEASLQREQASLIADEYEQAAIQKKREVGLFREEQAHRYLSGGVMLDGSPLAVLDETRRLGDQEVAALRRAGAAKARVIRMQADQLERTGLESLLTKQSENLTAKAQHEQQVREQKQQNMRKLIGAGLNIGSMFFRR